MQLRLEIICPFHQHQEVLTLPESYSVDFSGEVPCGAERHQATLYIALTVGEDVEADGLLDAVDEAERALLITSTANGAAETGARLGEARFTFVHELIRQTL